MSGKFEIFSGRGEHKYRFRLKASNREIIGASEGYASKQSAKHGIDSVKENAPHDYRYEVLLGRDGQYYFNLKAANGQIILRSEGYASSQGAKKGTDAVKRHAPGAPVIDLT